MTTDGTDLKLAETNHDIHELLRRRWSPRAFADREISGSTMSSLLEAARWAPSCFNEQPWSFVLAHRGDVVAFDRLLTCLAGVNQVWARRAAALMITVAKLAFDRNEKPNRHAFHDVGLAMENFSIQATAMGIAVHQMGGFDVARSKDVLGIPDGHEPVTAVAVGYPGDPETLDKKTRTSELAVRIRRPIAEFAFAGGWGRLL
ncbi:MAG: nitroreductase [Acidobacteria bacterium]|nr:nitroreductase [Acidobacteriota bacterium]MEC7768671.1 nitroreductase family protein [Acidobacteriota bacterium]